MARLTKREAQQIVEVFYGIDPKTFEVERVSLTRDGVLHKYNRDGLHGTHAILHGRQARTEIIIVWHLTDLISFPVGLDDDEYRKSRIAEMGALAEQKKAASKKEE